MDLLAGARDRAVLDYGSVDRREMPAAVWTSGATNAGIVDAEDAAHRAGRAALGAGHRHSEPGTGSGDPLLRPSSGRAARRSESPSPDSPRPSRPP
jgi:hypothetical protein